MVAPPAATTYTALFTAVPPAVTLPPATAVPVVPAAGPVPSVPQADTTAPAPAFALSVATNFDSAGKVTTKARWSVPFAADGTSFARIMRGSIAPASLAQGLPIASVASGARPLSGAPGILTTATLPALASGTTYALSVFQVDAAGNVSAPTSRLLVVPRVAGPTRPLSAHRLQPLTVRWRLTGRTGAPLGLARVAILVRAKGATRWRMYRRVITSAVGIAGVRTTVSADTEFVLRYNGDATRTGVQSPPVVVKLRAR